MNLGEPDTALPGDSVEKIHSAFLFEDGWVTQLVDRLVYGAAAGGFNRKIGPFPYSKRAHYLYGF